MMANLSEIWQQEYKIVPQQLAKVAEVKRAVTAFNTNIDAVIKISGKQISELATKVGLSVADLENTSTQLNEPRDVVRGIIKCFTLGIAEEWLSDNPTVYEWMRANLGLGRLQMGGQAGIVANVLAVLGVKEVCAHTSSHPQLQAEQFLDMPNLLAINADGKVGRAREVVRNFEVPLIHWIIEFDAGEKFDFAGKSYICPKANRFIATCDTANVELKINDGFIKYIDSAGFDYMIVSGYHSLIAKHGGMERIEATVPLLKRWKKANPHGIIHLELASTQDKIIRAAVIKKIAPLVDSVGLNEREALDVLEVIDEKEFERFGAAKLTAENLFLMLRILKNSLKTPRIQLHFFGTYLTLQDKNFAVSPQANKSGMMLAATVAAAKAGLGDIEKRENLLWAQNKKIGAEAIKNLQDLAEFLHNPQLAEYGIVEYEDWDLIAVPTIIVDKPKTLVGMGDTISSVSLIGAR